MRSRRLVTVLAVAAISVVSACGGGSNAGPVTVHFVGSADCPTAGASPYAIPATNGDPAVGTLQDQMPHTHVDTSQKVTYLHDPPTSGCHWNSVAAATRAPVAAGPYDKELPPEAWVHNLEHGYIVVLYNCQAPGTPNVSDPKNCPGDFQSLKDWFKTLPPDPAGNDPSCVPPGSTVAAAIPYAKVVILPWHTMKTKFAVVSWDWYLDLGQSLNMDQVKAFYDNHNGHAPEGCYAP